MSEENRDTTNIICSQCGSNNTGKRYSARDFDTSSQEFQLLHCKECELVWTNPAPSPDKMGAYYTNEYYGDDGIKFMPGIEKLTYYGNYLRARKLLKTLRKSPLKGPHYRVLDIGCGRANLLNAMNDMGCKCHGLERMGFPDSQATGKLNLHHGDINDLSINDEYFDLIIIWHALEHMHEPFNVIDVSSRLLKKNGLLVISVPNFYSLQSRLFKSSWFHLDIPRHLYHFGPHSLQAALGSRGFKTLSSNTCSLEQSAFGFIQSMYNKMQFLGIENSFYRALKKGNLGRNPVKFMIWSIGTLLVLPVALVEYSLSCLTRQGAVLTLFAQKSTNDNMRNQQSDQ